MKHISQPILILVPIKECLNIHISQSKMPYLIKKNPLYRSSKIFFTIYDKFNYNTEIFVECVIILYMYIQIYIFFYSAKKPSSLRVIRGPVFLSISLKHFKNGQE